MIKRPCHGLPPGAPCPTYQKGTWPRECVCYQEAQNNTTAIWHRLLIAVLAISVIIGVFSLVKVAVGADVDRRCLTQEQARAAYPGRWLYWHTVHRCWDDRPGQNTMRHPAAPKGDRLPPPAPSIDMPEGPTVAYPSLMQGNGSSDNMLRPDPMVDWPPVFDFDVDPHPFIPWQERVVSSLPAAGGPD